MNKYALYCLGIAALLSGCGGSGSASHTPAAEPVVAASTDAVPDEPSLLAHPDDAPLPDADDMADATAGPAVFTLAGYAAEGAAELADAASAIDDASPPLASLAASAATNLYVAPAGSDSNPGTASQPFRSLARAAKAVRPGTKVFVAPGMYSGGFRTSISGTAAARIVFLSTVKWGANIVPPKYSASKVAWDNRGSHVDIVGFEIDGSAYQGGVRWAHGIYNGGSYDAIRNNHVHHIAQGIGCTGAGGAAIGVDSYYRGAQADVIANLVHDIGPAGCRFIHGIYVSTSGRIKNNVVYRVAEGGIHLWHDARNVVITNNTVTTSNTGIIVGGGNFYYSKGPNDYTSVYSNIVYDNKMGISEQGKTGLNNSYRNNLVYGNSRYDWRLNNGLRHSDTVSEAPQLMGSSRSAAPNLRPAAGSPAIGQATAALAETTDFEGRPRNARAGYDIGAFQH
ncbi:MAG: DUF1565 domain-containing protein [Pseudomonadota bacterium]